MARIDINLDKYIARGKRNSPEDCPLALAARELSNASREHGPVKTVRVLGDVIEFTFSDGFARQHRLQDALVRAIRQFDETGTWPVDAREITFATELEAWLTEMNDRNEEHYRRAA